MEKAANLPQSEHLLLLIGSNPLPNAVAGKLLTAKGGTITLVHSDSSFQVAQRLQRWLHQQDFPKVRLKEVEESQPLSVARNVQVELQAVNAQQVGLNYTGGTKAMSVHAYRAVEQWANAQRKQGKNAETVFSYLDARKLEMVFDPADPSSGEHGHRKYVGLEVPLTLTDLLKMHGWTPKHPTNRQPILPASAGALAKVCVTDDGLNSWRQWIDDELRGKCRKPGKEDWKSKTALASTNLTLPSDATLNSVVQSLQDQLSLPIGDLTLNHPGFENSAEHFCEWLDGKWLEHHVLDVLNGVVTSLSLHEVAQNIETHEVQFDVDVIALRGYQLFAFSCSTERRKPLLKSKLFEAFARARQVGGDEARAAVVCCGDRPEELEGEMRNLGVAEGHIRVFGRKHLADLAAHLAQWIQDQSKGA